jgi:hypothetical protein
MLRGILEQPDMPALQRLRTLVHAFIQSECAEAPMRVALSDAAPLYRDAPQAREVRAAGQQIFQDFMLELLPAATAPTRELARELILSTLSCVGKEFSATPRTQEDITVYANAMADMFGAYLMTLSQS